MSLLLDGTMSQTFLSNILIRFMHVEVVDHNATSMGGTMKSCLDVFLIDSFGEAEDGEHPLFKDLRDVFNIYKEKMIEGQDPTQVYMQILF